MAVEQIAKTHQRKWDLIENHTLENSLRDGETYYLTTQGMCDCGTGLGVLAGDPAVREPDYTRKVKRLRQKGWSDAKIERWIENKERGRNVRLSEADCLDDPPADVVRWMNFIEEVLDSKSATYVGLLVHWYEGLIETERINVVDRKWIHYGEVNSEYLLRADEDVIHTFSFYRHHST